ncbi:2-isopropylmalate synthase [Methanofollis fontis]|uniref:Probable 2-isopropylmalate synthase n=1 Tax=Methanofollis fontis TaxID=2052832 RepID=A0A483CRQ1_9EURY|nr:2-isopropylmalate synthase [Methanofollis fontis]TAJ43719.1 2-isopropylmalate synthase [Methanofollis fontis]
MVFFTPGNARKNIAIFDTTLRDGEQTPGVSFTIDQKVEIARQIAAIGVRTIEAGFPASSADELEAVRTIAAAGTGAQVCGLSRMRKDDVDACIDAGVDMIHVFIPTSDIQREHTIRKSRTEVIDATATTVAYAREHFDRCLFSAMDATRTDWPYLIEVCRTAVEAGATTVNIPDTVGVMTPTVMRDLIARVVREVRAPIDVHCHNDFGLALANTLAAVEAGASQVQVTVNGMGERAGNADLAQTVMALERIYGIETEVITERLVETSRLVSRYAGISIPPCQPVVGENAFSHESGIHSHGVLERPDTFEPGIMTPEMVGHRRRLKLGKHAGRHAVRQSLADVHIAPSDAELDRIMEKMKWIAGRGRRITDADLYAIAEEVTGMGGVAPAVSLRDIAILTGNHVMPTASVNLTVNGEEKVACSTGNGPVDAAMKAIIHCLPEPVHLKEFAVESISGGTDAIGHVTITVEDATGHIFDASSSSDDVVIASVDAMVNAINLLQRVAEKKPSP